MAVIELWWADLTVADIGLLDTLPENERARVLRLARPADRGRRLLGAVLLQEAVRAHRPSGAPAPVEVDRTCSECGSPHGRPVVLGGPHLSVAHAGILVVVAACPDLPVGVDIEQVERFAATSSPPSPADPAAAVRDWVAREAQVKSGGADLTQVIELDPPLPGYVAALHVGGSAPLSARQLDGQLDGPMMVQVRQQRWRGPRGRGQSRDVYARILPVENGQ